MSAWRRRVPHLYYFVGGSAVCGGAAWASYRYAASHAKLSKDDAVVDTLRHKASCVFDTLAQGYDAAVGQEEWGMGYGLMRWLLMSYSKGDVLEISAGTGRNLQYYPFSNLSSLTLCDISKPMLERAEDKYFDELQLGERHSGTQVHFCLSDAHCLVAVDGYPHVGLTPEAAAARRPRPRPKTAEPSSPFPVPGPSTSDSASQGTERTEEEGGQFWRIFKPSATWQHSRTHDSSTIPAPATPAAAPAPGTPSHSNQERTAAPHPPRDNPPAPQTAPQQATGSHLRGSEATHTAGGDRDAGEGEGDTGRPKRLPELPGAGSLMNIFRVLIPGALPSKTPRALGQDGEGDEGSGGGSDQGGGGDGSGGVAGATKSEAAARGVAAAAAQAPGSSGSSGGRTSGCCSCSTGGDTAGGEPRGAYVARCQSGCLADGAPLTRFLPNSFDTVVDTFGLCSHEDPVQVLREAARLLKPGGRIILLEHGRASYGWLNSWLDDSAAKHHDKWGCWWNRDILDLLQQADLMVDSSMRWHFGTSYLVIAKPINSP